MSVLLWERDAGVGGLVSTGYSSDLWASGQNPAEAPGAANSTNTILLPFSITCRTH